MYMIVNVSCTIVVIGYRMDISCFMDMRSLPGGKSYVFEMSIETKEVLEGFSGSTRIKKMR